MRFDSGDHLSNGCKLGEAGSRARIGFGDEAIDGVEISESSARDVNSTLYQLRARAARALSIAVGPLKDYIQSY